MQEFISGDCVEWNFTLGKIRGHVIQKITSDTRIGNHLVRASHDEPQYLVESDYGNLAAHKPSSLTKISY